MPDDSCKEGFCSSQGHSFKVLVQPEDISKKADLIRNEGEIPSHVQSHIPVPILFFLFFFILIIFGCSIYNDIYVP